MLAVGSALAAARSQLADAQARDLLHDHDAGVLKALCLVNTRLDMQDHLREGIVACERTLALFGAPDDPDWEQNPAWLRLGPEERRRLAEDRRELLLLLADARVRQAAGAKESAVAGPETPRSGRIDPRPASVAGALARPSPLLVLAGRDGARRPGPPARRGDARHDRAGSLPDRGFDGPAAAVPETLRAAIAELDEALRLNPRHYWSLVQRGICHLERGELIEAAGDFGQCTGIWPEFAWGYFNRGCVLDRAGNKAAAVLDYTAALERDPDLVPAYVNRGLARLELKQHAAALADFDRARALGANDAIVSAGRGIALEGLGRHRRGRCRVRPRVRVARSRRPAGPDPRTAGLGLRFRHLRAATPTGRAAAFDDALRLDPRNAQALYGRAMIAMGRDENARRLRDFDRAIEADPGRNRSPPLPRDPARPPGRLESGVPRDQPMPPTRASVPGDALRGRLRRCQGLRRLRHDRDRGPVAGPPRAGPGRRCRPLAGRAGPRPRRDPPAASVPEPGRTKPGSGGSLVVRAALVSVMWNQPITSRSREIP